MLSGTKGETGDIFERIRLLLTETQGLVAAAKPVVQDAQARRTEAKPVLQDAKVLAAEARQWIAENKAPLSQAILQLDNPRRRSRSSPPAGTTSLPTTRKTQCLDFRFQGHFRKPEGHLHLCEDPHSEPLAATFPTHLGNFEATAVAQRAADSAKHKAAAGKLTSPQKRLPDSD